MKTELMAFKLVLFTALFIGLCTATGKGDKRKTAVLGLFPFPRTGRSHPSTWDIEQDFFNDYKRSKQLMAFPRVGRGNGASFNDDLNDGKSSEIWFGPRLGRVHKRDTIYRDTPLAYFIYGDSHTPRDVHYTPRLGRESDEGAEDYPLRSEQDTAQ